jgi:hypothetical protein
MNTRNLIPAKRLALKARANAIQRWSIINTAYLCLLGLGGVALFAIPGRRDVVADSTSVKAEVTQSNRTLASLRQESLLIKSNVQADQELSQTPDWSILFGALSDSLGDEIVLNRIETTDSSKSSVQPVGAPKTLRLSGVGRSQQAVTQFVLKLERMHFFEKVRLMQTAPQVLRGTDSVGFDLDCVLPGAAGGAP